MAPTFRLDTVRNSVSVARKLRLAIQNVGSSLACWRRKCASRSARAWRHQRRRLRSRASDHDPPARTGGCRMRRRRRAGPRRKSGASATSHCPNLHLRGVKLGGDRKIAARLPALAAMTGKDLDSLSWRRQSGQPRKAAAAHLAPEFSGCPHFVIHETAPALHTMPHPLLMCFCCDTAPRICRKCDSQTSFFCLGENDKRISLGTGGRDGEWHARAAAETG